MIDVPPSEVVRVTGTGAWAPLEDSQMLMFASKAQVQELLALLPSNVSNVTVSNGQNPEARYYGQMGGVLVYFLTPDGPRPYTIEGQANGPGGGSVRIHEFVGGVLHRRQPGHTKLEVFPVNSALGELRWA